MKVIIILIILTVALYNMQVIFHIIVSRKSCFEDERYDLLLETKNGSECARAVPFCPSKRRFFTLSKPTFDGTYFDGYFEGSIRWKTGVHALLPPE